MPDYTQIWSDLSLDLKARDDDPFLILGAACQEDAGRLKTRIETFVERVHKK
jgi:hypothetical protein